MSDNKDFPVEFKYNVFTKLNVEAVPNHEPPQGNRVTTSPNNNINIELASDQKAIAEYVDYAVTMTTTFNLDMNPSDPYKIEAQCISMFSVKSELPEDERIRALSVIGNSVTYGAIREAVAWITGRQVYGSLNLGLSILKGPQKPEDSK